MKKMFFKFSICTIAAAFMLTGCNNNESEFSKEDPILHEGKLSFVLPIGKKESSTYANGVQGLDDEYAIDNLFIYWFVKDGANYKFQQVFTYVKGQGGNTITLSNATVTATTPSTIATVAVGETTTQSHFYIVANVNLNGKAIHSESLTTLGAGTSESAFTSFITDTLAKIGLNIVPIETPLPMAINASGTGTTGGFVNVNDPTTAGVVNVHMKRRVARFDIVNNADYTGFRILRIIISNAQRRGWILDKPFENDNWTTEDIGKGSTIINGQSANGHASAKVDSNQDGIYDDFQLPSTDPNYRDSAEINRAVFYLWPTVMMQNIPSDPPTGSTEIVIEGSVDGGASRIYKLKLAADEPIDANKIYKIKVFRAFDSSITLSIIVDNWDEERELETVGSDYIDWTKASFSSSKPSGDGTTVNLTQTADQTFTYSSTIFIDTVTLTIVTKGINRTAGATDEQMHTTDVRIVPRGTKNLLSDLTDLTNSARIQSTTTFTYGKAEYTTTHVIKLPPTNAILETTLEIINPILPKDIKIIKLTSLNYNKSGFKPHLINENDKKIYWSPINVGALQLAGRNDTGNDHTDDAKVGEHFQWGRNHGWYPSDNPVTVSGPITPTNINANAVKFVYNQYNIHNWLVPWDITLWSGANEQGPCPSGWRLPSEAEANNLLAKAIVSDQGHNLYVMENNAVVLCLPAAGDRVSQSSGGTHIQNLEAGLYWLSACNDNGTCRIMHFNASEKRLTNLASVSASSVRCVRSAD